MEGHNKKNAPKDRHSSTGLRGLAKKGGHGGKGTWLGKGIADENEVNQDREDPNYNSDEDDALVFEKTLIQTPFEAVLHELFYSADLDEAAKNLQELDQADRHHQFVKKALVLAMERSPFDKELISKMLSAYYNKVIAADKIADGFQEALKAINDIVLDTPNAVEILAKFLARAIMDEVVPPAFLKTANAESQLASEVIALATAMTTETLRSERLEHVWGAGDLSSVKRLKGEVNLILKEYLTNGDKSEADKALRALNVPSFHFQVVKDAIRLGIGRNAEQRKSISDLFKYFNETGLISVDHFNMGFRTCQAQLKDISLDVPNAPKLFEEVVQLAKADKYLPEDWQL